MTEERKIAMDSIRAMNIITALHELYGVTIMEAMDMFYMSTAADRLEDKIDGLQSSSDRELAALVWEEYRKNRPQ